MFHKLILATIFMSAPAFAQQSRFGQWHTTHGTDKFPCMNEKEEEFFNRYVNVEKTEERIKLLADHRRTLSSKRTLASVSPNHLNNKNFICPPFRGVRNPHPQTIDFGKASTFERIKITENHMEILNGLGRNQKWDLNFNSNKGFFEGKTPKGTPTNLIPITPPSGQEVRFLVQYIVWQDKTAPTLTLCYREDLHKACNPYKSPEEKQAEKALEKPAVASPAGSSNRKLASPKS